MLLCCFPFAFQCNDDFKSLKASWVVFLTRSHETSGNRRKESIKRRKRSVGNLNSHKNLRRRNSSKIGKYFLHPLKHTNFVLSFMQKCFFAVWGDECFNCKKKKKTSSIARSLSLDYNKLSFSELDIQGRIVYRLEAELTL